jgi:hypothetical protein
MELGLDPLEVAEKMKSQLMDDSIRFGDSFIINWSHLFQWGDYLYRGLYREARVAAMRLLESGAERNDPRAIGMGNMALGFVNLFSDDPVAAETHGQECQRVAVTTFDRLWGATVNALSKVLLGRPREGLLEIEALDAEFERTGSFVARQPAIHGVALVLLGRISQGIHLIEGGIAQYDAIGAQFRAASCRVALAEIYIQILSSNEKPVAAVLLANLWTIAGAMIFGARRARKLLGEAATVKMVSERGAFAARINFDLGLLSAMKKKRNEARSYFEKARVGAESQGADKLLQKIDAALAELQRG